MTDQEREERLQADLSASLGTISALIGKPLSEANAQRHSKVDHFALDAWATEALDAKLATIQARPLPDDVLAALAFFKLAEQPYVDAKLEEKIHETITLIRETENQAAPGSLSDETAIGSLRTQLANLEAQR